MLAKKDMMVYSGPATHEGLDRAIERHKLVEGRIPGLIYVNEETHEQLEKILDRRFHGLFYEGIKIEII